MREIEQGLVQLKGRWMTGGGASPGEGCPEGWRALAEGDAAPDLVLLALAGQAAQVAFRPVPAVPLTEAKPIPRLKLPPLPDAERGAFRRLIETARPDAATMRLILTLMARRGHAAHPADWIPGADDDAWPGLYAPWCDWLSAATAEDAPEALTAETWELWLPGERRVELEAMRRRDPAAAGALIAAKAPGELADQRLRLVRILADGLGEADLDFLRTLGDDRSAKVRTLAGHLLARLGQGGSDPEAAAELVGFFQKGRAGILSRRTAVTPAKLKTQAQRTRRAELFATVPLDGFAAALDMSVAALIEAWDSDEVEATNQLIQMTEATGSAVAVTALAGRVLAGDLEKLHLVTLFPRLQPNARRAMLEAVLSQDALHFATALACAGDHLGELPVQPILAAPGLRALTKAVEAALAGNGADRLPDSGLFNFGLLADREGAARLIDHFTQTGLMSVDPKLAMLRFNAALERRSET